MSKLTLLTKGLFGIKPTPEDYGQIWARISAPAAGASNESLDPKRRYVAKLTKPTGWSISQQELTRINGKPFWLHRTFARSGLTTPQMLDFLREHDQSALPDDPHHISNFPKMERP